MRPMLAVVLPVCAPFVFAQSTPQPPRQDAAALAAAIDGFGADLLARLGTKDGNVCVSPASIAVTLLMAMQGAREQTLAELATLLHLGDWPAAKVAEATTQLLVKMREPGRGIELAVANDLWPQAGHPLRADFLAAITRQFAAEVTAVDFARDVAAACKTVNARVAAATKGRIPDLVSPALVSPETRLVLTNAVYFHANWSSPFESAATQDGPFRLPDGTQVKTPQMHQVRKFSLVETEDLQVLWLPYVDQRFGLAVALPRGKGTIEQAMAALLRPESRRLLQRQRKTRLVTLTLPRFHCEVSLDLSDTLAAAGLRTAMLPGADFRGIDDGAGQLYLAKVIHRVFLDVGEAGTEAAAATAGVLVPTAAMPSEPPEPAVFCADHAFVYAIVDDHSGLCWFVGRVVDPR